MEVEAQKFFSCHFTIDINPVLVNRIHKADWLAVLRKYNLEYEE